MEARRCRLTAYSSPTSPPPICTLQPFEAAYERRYRHLVNAVIKVALARCASHQLLPQSAMMWVHQCWASSDHSDDSNMRWAGWRISLGSWPSADLRLAPWSRIAVTRGGTQSSRKPSAARSRRQLNAEGLCGVFFRTGTRLIDSRAPVWMTMIGGLAASR